MMPRTVTVPTLDLEVTATTGRQYVPYVAKHLRAAHTLLRPRLTELSLALVGDARMSALHRQFLNIPGPTDVLTFPLDTDARGRVIAGEVVICVPEARRRAAREGTEVRKELLLYALHGLLHLAGFNDSTELGFRAMHRKEDDILTRIGVGPVFAARQAVMKQAGSSRRPPSQTKRRATGAKLS